MADRIIRVSPEEMKLQEGFSEEFSRLSDRPKTYFIVTFGCQMNAHDSEKLAGMMDKMGMSAAASREEADFVLFNTCCVRDNAERKALGNATWIKELKKDRPGMLLGICGCMVQEPGMAEKLLASYPFIDIAFGTGNYYMLPQILLKAVLTGKRNIAVSEEDSTVVENVPIHRESDYQSYVTIMYGCNNFCSYCIVPYVRGRERSRTMSDILHEVEELQNNGVKEIMLLGQNVNSYGKDLGAGNDFSSLLSAVAATGIPRIRFMTSHPKDLTDSLIEVIAKTPSICRHFHLPAQSGNDRILRLMNRHYTIDQYMERVHRIRDAVPDIGLTTDLIVAFPGETEAEFMDTMKLVDEVGYDSAFTFIYSPRVGTRAAAMPDQIPDDIASERIGRLIALQEKKTEECFKKLIGSKESVLITGCSRRDENALTGKIGRNISVNFSTPCPGSYGPGDIVNVKITGYGKTTLRGTLLNTEE